MIELFGNLSDLAITGKMQLVAEISLFLMLDTLHVGDQLIKWLVDFAIQPKHDGNHQNHGAHHQAYVAFADLVELLHDVLFR